LQVKEKQDRVVKINDRAEKIYKFIRRFM